MARPRQVSDDEILEAARAVFLEHGPSVSTQVIADRLGVSQAALFKRFGTKQDLMLRAMAPPAVPEWVPLVEQGPDDRPIPEQLLDIANLVSDFFERMMPRLAIIKASGINVDDVLNRYDMPPPVRARAALVRWLEVAQEQGRLGPIDPATTGTMLLGSLQGRVFLEKVLGIRVVENRDTYISELIQTLWRGIAPVEEP